MIDAHVHSWPYDAEHRRWLEGGHPTTTRAFPLAELDGHLVQEGAASALLVQSLDSLAETRTLVAASADAERIGGVVGYLPLQAPEDVTRLLEDESLTSGLRGVRSVADWDETAPAIASSLEHLAATGLCIELLGLSPRVWAKAVRVAERHPDLTVVVDHLGNPRSGADLAHWADGLRAAAARPNCVAKISGMGAVSDDVYGPALDCALDGFGPERLMFGSDWPITLRSGPPLAPLNRLEAAIGALSDAERTAVTHGTAQRRYRLSASRAEKLRP